MASLCLYVWGLVLGYFALREQFELNHLETVVLGLFALLLVTSSWHFSNHVLERVARETVRPTNHTEPAHPMLAHPGNVQ
jgi:hypothetical protein